MIGYNNIPVALCQFALVNRKVNQLKLYVYLKINSDGFVSIDSSNFKEWASDIGLTPKTVKSSFDWLIQNKWIIINSKRKAANIISYKKLAKKLNLKYDSGLLFEPESMSDYEYFKAFCCTSVIHYYLRKKRYYNERSVAIKGATTTNRKWKKGFYPMANAYLAKCLGVSIATACRIKQEAENAGFIETSKNYSFIEDNSGKKVKKEAFDVIKRVHITNGGFDTIRMGKRYVKVVESDLIFCRLKTKKRGVLKKGKN